MDVYDEDDDYERTRQEQIKQNKELLKSLGLNAETTRLRSPSPPHPPPPKKKPRPSDPVVKRDVSPLPLRERSSRRTASSMNYNEKEIARKGYSGREEKKVRQPREGNRKSGRISTRTRSKYAESDTSDTNSDDYVAGPSSRGIVQLNKVRNPAPAVEYEEDSDQETDELGVYPDRMPIPTRQKLPKGLGGNGHLIFEDKWSHFRPTLTPEEILRGGAFGGTFFKPHWSAVLRTDLDPAEDLANLPSDWISGLDQESMLTSEQYDPAVNRFKRKAGQSLEEWEKAGWIAKMDPRGWFQWYYRFYLGRRTKDDARQVGRWQRACGPAGRFRRTIVSSVAKAGSKWDDEEVAPVIRQVCWQWAYILNAQDAKELYDDRII